ncbi:MAG: helix-turn-helix domain-containing protein [Brachymonas sp.]
MSQFSILLKKEIGRIAKKEVRAEVVPAKKSSSQARSEIAALKKRVARLEALIKRLGTSAGRGRSAAAETVDADSPKLRFRAGGFATLRKKLKLSAHEMAKLLGVSAQSVYHWETGKSKPQARQLAAIAAVRKLGKKEVTARLAG